MTEEQTKRIEVLHKKLTYGRGITFTEWDELTILRTQWLKDKGLNPAEYDLGSRNCKKK